MGLTVFFPFLIVLAIMSYINSKTITQTPDIAPFKWWFKFVGMVIVILAVILLAGSEQNIFRQYICLFGLLLIALSRDKMTNKLSGYLSRLICFSISFIVTLFLYCIRNLAYPIDNSYLMFVIMIITVFVAVHHINIVIMGKKC